MNLKKDFKISDLSAEIRKEIDIFITELKKSYPNIAAVIVFDDPSHINDNTDDEINLCIVSDDFLDNLGCTYHIPCRGKEFCIVRRHEDKLSDIVDRAAEIKKTYAIEIRPYPMSIKMYLSGDTYSENWLYGRSGLYYGDKKYDPKTVDAQIDWKAVYNEVVKYEGATIDNVPFSQRGKPIGQGKMTWYNGEVYEGAFTKGNFCGKGILYYANGDRLEAEFDGSETYGYSHFYAKGTLYHVDGTKYIGRVTHDGKSGFGILYDKDGNILFEGDWDDGYKNPPKVVEFEKCILCNEGKLTDDGLYCHECNKRLLGFSSDKNARRLYSLAVCYEYGKYKDQFYGVGKNNGLEYAIKYYKEAADAGLKEAEAAVKRLTEERYIAKELDSEGKPKGKGTKILSDGTRVEGEWKNGKLLKAKIYYISGDTYDGTLKNGKYNGYGVFVRKQRTVGDDDVFEGIWKNGKMHGSGSWTYGKFSYVGEYKNGQWHGQGTHTNGNGNRYEGQFVKGYMDGLGVYTYANGDRYEGEFVHGNPNSWSSSSSLNAYFFAKADDKPENIKKFTWQGIYFWGGGMRYEGGFKNGKFHGLGAFYSHDSGKFKYDESNWVNGERHGSSTAFYHGGTSRTVEYVKGRKVENDD